MTRSELIERMAERQGCLVGKGMDRVVKIIIDELSTALANGRRIEIRGFGSFSLHYRAARIGRNPKTGRAVNLAARHVPHFKPGKRLRELVDSSVSQG